MTEHPPGSSGLTDPPRLLLDAPALAGTVARLAVELGEDHGDDTVLVSILKGSMIFTSDLARALPFHPLIDFMAISSYEEGQQAQVVKDLTLDVGGADVVLVEDVIDTGLSVQFLLSELQRREPRSLTVCTLVDKVDRRLLPVQIDHVGVATDEDFVIGYGLDFAGRYRNLDLLAAADLGRLTADPDCYQSWAYSRSA